MADRLPAAIRETALGLARKESRSSAEEAARLRARREALLEEFGFTSRIRDEDERAVLVCYPSEWIVEGTIDREAIDDIDRAVELPIDGPVDPESWSALATDNQKLAKQVHTHHGPIHGNNADAFVVFMNNHRARPVRSATSDDIEEFLTEYYPRNAWANEDERAVVEDSLDLLFKLASNDPVD